MAAAQITAFPRRKLALIIGNDNYSKTYNKLNGSVKNAKKIRNLLKQIAFDVTIHTNIDANMMELIQNFCEQIDNGDLVLFYYSGHGCQVNGENYLIPIDDSNIEAETDVEDIGILVKNILKRLIEKNPSYATIAIFDCCVPYNLQNPTSSTPMVEDQTLGEIVPISGAFVQLICTAKQTDRTDQATNTDNVFNKHLIKTLTRKDVDITNIFQDIAMDVQQESNQTRQILFMHGLLSGGKIFLNKVSKIIPNVPKDAKWKFYAKTVAGDGRCSSTSRRLYCPKGIHVNKYQYVYIADSLNHRVMKFTRGTNTPRRIISRNISGYGPERLCGPSNIIYDYQSKSFIISDYYNQRVLRWCQNNSTCTETIIEGSDYFGLAMDDEGFLYVSDTGRHEVKRYRPGDHDGIVVAGGNGQGAHLNQLDHPTYIFIGPDKSVYVSDTWNDRVVRWDKGAADGVTVAGGQGKGRDRSQLNHPTGLIVDQFGTIYVADYWNHRVMRWYRGAAHGERIVGHKLLSGYKADQLNGPEGLAFDRYGNLYVADSNNHRIQRFRIEAD
ncbi:unnamed protein product [Rotaria socialis]|uniref:Caspase family p20 domain-containing protein n=1 Tax=Rotaria socialis TaxID=392032 RepID=A0A818JB96_9BILA|nr:unnamed protein product [Rotaria socialis]CAF3409790.1 unnamed protein product [Rotaria socialis]CAF3533147.1 unnamed protein product [Rotaria socialis]CAF3683468.1 unnamed protein product [Rotaria socialis]CAF4400587.1 unnamed protein product [Rotaria socialis]